MSKKDAFFKKYKDPRWQKRRLEKMQEADFMCEICGDNESTLNVHHKYYIQGNEPWEYKDEALTVLCEHCHNDEHEDKENTEMMLRLLREYFTNYELTLILDGIIREYQSVRDDDCQYSKKNCIIKGIRSGLLLNIGGSLVSHILESRKKIKEEYEVEQ